MATDLTKVRNIGICAHIDAGKTTVSERILFYTGRNYKIGEVHEGMATMDFLQEEQERGITIQSAATTCPWEKDDVKYKINLIDTPGHVDFTIEVERSLRVLDGACAVFDGKEGVEAQSETVWRQADRYGVPRLCFINKMDKMGADWDYSFASIRSRLGANGIAIQLPIGKGNDFAGVIDLVEMKAIRFSTEDQGGTLTYEEIPADLLEKAEYYRAELIEKVSEVDDDMMELFLTDPSKITNEHIKAGLRKGTIAIKCFPVLCGAALKNIGVQKILDAAIDYLPNPTERPDTKGVNPDDVNQAMTRPHDPTAPFSALVFKVVSDTHGDLTYIRVYSGKLDKGTRVLNPGNGKRENVSRIFEMHANNRNALEEVDAGNIVAVVGLKNSYTGDTICDPENPIILERMTFPEPVISMAIEPITADDKKKLGDALTTIRREDPSFRSNYNDETGETIIAGMGELHLEIIKNKLTRDMKIGVNVGKPRVSYRETITGQANEVRGLFKKQSGGRGHADHAGRGGSSRTEDEGRRCVRRQDLGRRRSARVHPVDRIRRASSSGLGRSRRLPRHQRARPTRVRFVPRRRLEPGRLRTGGHARLPRGGHEGEAGAPRAHHEARRHDAGRILRQRVGRHRVPPRSDHRSRDARQRTSAHLRSAALRTLRLHDGAPLDDARSRDKLDGAAHLPRHAREAQGRCPQEVILR